LEDNLGLRLAYAPEGVLVDLLTVDYLEEEGHQLLHKLVLDVTLGLELRVPMPILAKLGVCLLFDVLFLFSRQACPGFNHVIINY
jgi:hypothetical protein